MRACHSGPAHWQWARCRNSSGSERGFTLIEILVVVVIIGVMLSALVSLRGGGGLHRYLQDEIYRVEALIQLVREKAIVTGMPARMLFSSDGYRFESWILVDSTADSPSSSDLNSEPAEPEPEGKWQTLEDNLGPYSPENRLRFRLSVEDKRGADGIIFYPDGTTTAARISVRMPGWKIWYELRTDGVSAFERHQYDK